MASTKMHDQSTWNRFKQLFELPKAEREKSYSSKNLALLKNFVASEMTNCSLPEIDNAQDFSETIESLGINYRLWNQRLMGLMIAHDQIADQQTAQDLQEFAATCPWSMLVEVVRNAPDTSPGDDELA
ncbi:hypothetical protein ACO0LF_30690 [Undibacterium sp. Di27W]|uniref:hypothetical protein n=1 Tax=Undibacterium sp. Di27W TaxID=3413036 RepID=UPI003BF2F9A4